MNLKELLGWVNGIVKANDIPVLKCVACPDAVGYELPNDARVNKGNVSYDVIFKMFGFALLIGHKSKLSS